jgi:hypothetical protein
MKANPRFLNQPKHFWANVRLVSEKSGYTKRGVGQIKVPDLDEVVGTLERLGLGTKHVARGRHAATELGDNMLAYFAYRARQLNRVAEPNLMSAAEAKRLYHQLKNELKPTCPLPTNKQTGAKKAPAYLTCIVNMLIEANCAGYDCDYDPRSLTTITRNGSPVRTLARRIDGCFPGTVNPVAVWELKEYYHTTTFGSRVANGVYESLLDGMELEELRNNEKITVKHYLIVDAHYTWWECGRSYLCRIVGMLHMGYVDEVLFGREVLERLPVLVRQWVRAARRSR